jgi:Mn-dependent DtxR family transcriptional regulator
VTTNSDDVLSAARELSQRFQPISAERVGHALGISPREVESILVELAAQGALQPNVEWEGGPTVYTLPAPD